MAKPGASFACGRKQTEKDDPLCLPFRPVSINHSNRDFPQMTAEPASLDAWRHAIAGARVPPLTKPICFVISDHLENGDASPPTKTLRVNSGLSATAVRLHRENAIKAGLLAIDDGRHGVPVYRARMPAP